MASNFIGMNRGKQTSMNQGVITVGSATGATDFEFRVDTGKGSTKKDAILALEAIRRYIECNGVGTNTQANVGANLPPN